MKIKVKGIEYELKYISLPDNHGFDDSSLALLVKFDEAVGKSRDGFQDQLNAAFVAIENKGMRTYGSDIAQSNPRQVELTAKWIRNFFQKKDTSAVEMELKQFQTKDFNDFLDTTDATTGGYLVPELLAAEVFRVVEENGFARRDMRYLPFSGPGNSRKLPIEGTGLTLSWIDEMEKKPLSNITFDQVSQTLGKLACISVMSEELIEDSAINLIEYVARRAGESIAEEEDSQFFAGAGAPWTGIINTAGCQQVDLGAGNDALIDLTPNDMLNMIFAVSKKYRPGAKFYFSSDVLLSLLKFRADSGQAPGDQSGSYLVGSPMQNIPMTLWGYPISVSDVLPGADDAATPDTPFAFFGNLQKCAVYGDKGGMRAKILDQATLTDADGYTINLAQVDANALRIMKRVGYCLTLPEGISVLSTGAAS
jgi:HK97 family phage major capsid protein